MNRDQAVSFGDPIPMRLGKALTKEDLEKRAALAEAAAAPTPFDPPVLPTWAVERAAQAWCAPSAGRLPMEEFLAWEFARILAVEAGELAPRAGEVVESHRRQVRKLSAHAAAYGGDRFALHTGLNQCTDAARWAAAFADLFAVNLANGLSAGDDTQGLMLGWFANAIEAGRDEGLRQAQRFAQQEAEKAKVPDPGADCATVSSTPWVGLHE